MSLKEFLKPLIPKVIREATYPLREALAQSLANRRARALIRARILEGKEALADLDPFEMKVCSQNGEDGILEAIFARLGEGNRYFVEFGVEDGTVCNSAYLKRKGWTGLQMDAAENNPPSIKREFISAENIQDLFKKYGVPAEPDLLSIDIDGNDYWVWKAIVDYKPRAMVVEYNAGVPLGEARTIPYDPKHLWDGTQFFGASLDALVKLGREKGYTLVATDTSGVNAFFVRDDLVAGNFKPRPLAELWRPLGPKHEGWKPAPGRDWQEV